MTPTRTRGRLAVKVATSGRMTYRQRMWCVKCCSCLVATCTVSHVSGLCVGLVAPQKLLAGTDDLDSVTKLELSVDTTEQSINRLGELCPNLRQLKLNDSQLCSFRDLGTNLRNLRILWLSRSGITDLDGITVLELLEELYVSFNDIEDLSPLSVHDTLSVLDLEANNVDDVDQLETLSTCPMLMSLNLEGNPIDAVPHYRRVVVTIIPQLELVDDEDVTEEDREKVRD